MIPLTQSSCTRSELEAESKQTNNMLEYKQLTERHFSIPSHKNAESNGQAKIQSNFPSFLTCDAHFTYRQFTNSPACDVSAANNLIPTREDDLSPKKKICLHDNNPEKASRDIELVHIIDNPEKNNMQMEVDTVTTSIGNDEKGSIPAHQLELSLRRTDYGKLESQEKNDRRTLNHSTSSAFSL